MWRMGEIESVYLPDRQGLRVEIAGPDGEIWRIEVAIDDETIGWRVIDALSREGRVYLLAPVTSPLIKVNNRKAANMDEENLGS